MALKVGDIVAFLKLDTKDYDTGLKDSEKSASKFSEASGKAFQAAQKAATIAFAAMVGVIGKAIKEAIAFEKQMAKVNTMLTKDSKVSLQTFSKGIRTAAKDFGQSTETLTTGLYDILSATIPAEEAMRVLEDAAAAATGGFTDTATATSAIITLMSAFEDSTYDSAYAADILHTAVKRGRITFEQMAQGIGTVATLSFKAGLSMEEMAGFIASSTRAGIDAEITMTNFRGVLASLLKPTDDLTEALDGMTLETDGFTAIMEHVGAMPVDTISRLFPNVRALTGVITAAQGLGTEVGIIHDIMEDGSPAMDAFAIATDTIAFRMSQLKETFKVTIAEAAENLLPTMEKMVEIGIKVIEFIVEWREAIILFLVAFKGVPLILNLANTAMVAFGASTTIALGPIGLITAAIAGIAMVVGALRKKYREAAEEQAAIDARALERIQTNRAAREAAYNEWLNRSTAQQAIEERARLAGLKADLDELKSRTSKIKGLEDIIGKTTGVLEVEEKIAASEKRLAKLRSASAEEIIQALTNERDAVQALINALAKKKPEDTRELMAYNLKLAASVKRRDALNEEIQTEQEKTGVILEGIETTTEAEQTQAEWRAETLEEQTAKTEEAQQQMLSDRLVRLEEEQQAEWEAFWAAKERTADEVEAKKAADEEIRKSFSDLQKNETEIATAAIDKRGAEYKAAGADKKAVDDWVWAEKLKIYEAEETASEKMVKMLKDGLKSVVDVMWDSFLPAFTEMGESLAEGATGVDALKDAFKSFGRALLDALPGIMLSIGVQLLGTPLWPVGIGLIVASGLMAGIMGWLGKRKGLEEVAEALEVTKAEEKEVAVEEVRRALLTPRERAIEDLLAEIKELMAAGVDIGMINEYKAQEEARINEQYPLAQFGGVIEAPPGVDAGLVRVTRGEFIMPAQETAANLDVLEAMRAGGGAPQEIEIQAVPVVIELNGREVGRGMIDFIENESGLGAFILNQRVMRETE